MAFDPSTAALDEFDPSTAFDPESAVLDDPVDDSVLDPRDARARQTSPALEAIQAERAGRPAFAYRTGGGRDESTRRRLAEREADAEMSKLGMGVMAKGQPLEEKQRIVAAEKQRVAEKFAGPRIPEQTIGPIEGAAPTAGNVAKDLLSQPVYGLRNVRAGIRQAAGDVTGSEYLQRQGQQEAADVSMAREQSNPQIESEVAGGLYSGLQSLTRQAPAIAASVLTGNPSIGLASMGADVGGEAYTKYRGRGATPLEALTGATGEAAAEIITERTPMGVIVGKLGKVGAGRFMADLLAKEIPGEQAATLVQDAIDTAIANPDKTWGQYVAERPGAATQTLLATIGQAGAMGAIGGGVRALDRRVQNQVRADEALRAESLVREQEDGALLSAKTADEAIAIAAKALERPNFAAQEIEAQLKQASDDELLTRVFEQQSQVAQPAAENLVPSLSQESVASAAGVPQWTSQEARFTAAPQVVTPTFDPTTAQEDLPVVGTTVDGQPVIDHAPYLRTPDGKFAAPIEAESASVPAVQDPARPTNQDSINTLRTESTPIQAADAQAPRNESVLYEPVLPQPEGEARRQVDSAQVKPLESRIKKPQYTKQQIDNAGLDELDAIFEAHGTLPKWLPDSVRDKSSDAKRFVYDNGEFAFQKEEDAANYAKALELGEGGKWNAAQDGRFWRAVRVKEDRPLESRMRGNHSLMTKAMEMIGEKEDAFQLPKPDESIKSFGQIAKSIDPGYVVAPMGQSRAKLKNAERGFEVKLPSRRSADIYERSDKVWIDVSRLEEGKDDGKRVYAMAAAYAYNNGKVFIGDPAGLSKTAWLRRTENMISSIIKYGTSKHLYPHAAQVDPEGYASTGNWGDEGYEFAKNLRPIEWIEGNDTHNLRELMAAARQFTIAANPSLRELSYDARADTFRRADGRADRASQSPAAGGFDAATATLEDSEQGGTSARDGIAENNGLERAIGNGEIQQAARTARDRGAKVGSTAIKRTAVVNSLLREQSPEGRRKVLDALGESLRGRPSAPEPLKGIFYSKTAPQQAGLSVSGVRKLLSKRLGGDAVRALERAGLLDIRETNDTGYGSDATDGLLLNGKAYLFADRLTAETAVPVLMEELGEHFGLEAMLGERGYQALGRNLALMDKANNKAVRKAFDEVRELYPELEANDPRLINEAIAKLGRDAAARGQSWWRNLVAQIKAWLGKTIGVPIKMTDADVGALIEGSLRRVIGGAHGSLATAESRAYHGSPYKFDKFSTEKIGTGEGAQAYGHGLYFASKKEIAEHYKNALRGDPPSIDGFNLDPKIKTKIGSTFEFYRTQSGKKYRGNRVVSDAAYDAAYEKALTNYKAKKGKLYEVEIPEDSEMLLWDKPLSEQPEKVLAALRRIESPMLREMLQPFEMNNTFGSAAYNAIKRDLFTARDASNALLADGVKGIKYLDGGSRSAGDGTYNYVIFDDKDVEIVAMESRLRPSAAQQTVANLAINNQQGSAGAFDLPTENKFTAFERYIADSLNRVRDVQKAIRDQGGDVEEFGPGDVYRAAERFPGIVTDRLDAFTRNEVEPFLKDLDEAGITPDEMALYAYAKHAQERNDYIASINEKIGDAGSGMSNADADQIIAEAEGGDQADAYKDLHGQLLAMTKGTRDLMVSEGLITQEQADAWGSQYENYVPLKGWADEVDDAGKKRGTGQGFSISGKESLPAMGRRSRAGQIIENILLDRERALIRAEKNRVGKSLLQLVLDNPDENLWELDPVERKPTLIKDADTGERSVIYQDRAETGDNVFKVKVKGTEIRIALRDDGFAKAIKSLSDEQIGPVLRFMSNFNSMLSRLYTGLNPTFVVINGFRDLTTGLIQAQQYDPKLSAKILKHYKGALGASLRFEYDGKAKTQNRLEWDKWFGEYSRNGGRTGFMALKSLEDKVGDVQRMFRRHDPNAKLHQKAWARVMTGVEAIEGINGAIENATRLAAYRGARELGMSPAKAVSVAKNITVNFNRRGEYTRHLAPFFLFFNAAVQGSNTLLKSMKNPRVLGAISALTAGATALAVLNASMGGDDEETGIANWDLIPAHIKERNLVIMLPPGDYKLDGVDDIGKQGRYIKIPMPYGVNVFTTAAQAAVDGIRNMKDATAGRSPLTAAAHTLSSVANSYNPFGGGQPLQGVAPIVQPAFQAFFNYNRFGEKLYPEPQFNRQEARAEQFFESQRGNVFQKTADVLNRTTGGNAVRDGLLSVQPAVLDNTFQYFTGGAGQFARDIATPFFEMQDKGDVTISKLPFAKQLYGTVATPELRKAFQDKRQEAVKTFQEFKTLAERGEEKNPNAQEELLIGLGEANTAISKALADLRRWELATRDDEKLSTEERRKQLNQIEFERRNIYGLFLREWKQGQPH